MSFLARLLLCTPGLLEGLGDTLPVHRLKAACTLTWGIPTQGTLGSRPPQRRSEEGPSPPCSRLT